MDPLKLGFIVAKNSDILLDSYKRNSKSSFFPCFSFNETTDKIEFLYPFEINNLINMGNNVSSFNIECLDLNMYTSVQFLKNQIFSDPSGIFKYRIKEKNVHGTYQPPNTKSMGIVSQIDWLPQYFAFEINIMNLLVKTENVKLCLENRNEFIDYYNWVDKDPKAQIHV